MNYSAPRYSQNTIYSYHSSTVTYTPAPNSNGGIQIASLTSYQDFYPYGMPLPGKRLEGQEKYRFAYQGQEKDEETGKEAFQLRMWDARIARWLTRDPYSQYVSPYLGMGNDPANGIDPDGGFKTKFGAWMHKITHGGSGDIQHNEKLGYHYQVATKYADPTSSSGFGYSMNAVSKWDVNVNASGGIDHSVKVGFLKYQDRGTSGVKADLFSIELYKHRLEADPSSSYFRFVGQNGDIRFSNSLVVETGTTDWGASHEGVFNVNKLELASSDVSLKAGKPFMETKFVHDRVHGIYKFKFGLQEDYAQSLNYYIIGLGGKINVNAQFEINF